MGPQIRAFPAVDLGVERDESAVTVGFARDISDEDSYDAFMVQRSADPDEDEPGVAGVYTEIPSQRFAMYGEISAAVLRRTSFAVLLTPEGARTFGGIDGFEATFEANPARFQELRDALRFVFRNCACYSEAE